MVEQAQEVLKQFLWQDKTLPYQRAKCISLEINTVAFIQYKIAKQTG